MKAMLLKHGWTVLVDDEDFDRLRSFNWHARTQGGSVYLLTRMQTGSRRRTVMMHRFIMGEPIGMEVDHINGTHCFNVIDNQRSNLRIATRSLNSRNRRSVLKSKSGICGVRWIKTRNRWAAVAYPNSKQFRIGSFQTKEAAAESVENWKRSVGYRDAPIQQDVPRPIFEIECRHCGVKTKTTRETQLFCSKRCRQQYWERNHAKSLNL